MDVQYTPQAPEGKKCVQCKFYQKVNEQSGKCFGHDVIPQGGCNKFTAK